MAEFTTGVEEIDAGSLEEWMYEELEARFEGWRPAEGHPLTWASKAFARIGALLYGQFGLSLTAMFKRFGESLIGVPPITAAPAVADSTWTVSEASAVPRTIPAGTQVKIPGPDEKPLGFRTLAAVTVAAEATSATVALVAIDPGAQGNELSGSVTLSDSLSWIESIELDAPTANGVDEEDEDAYLARLVETLQMLSLSLIVGRDFEIDARGVAGVARVKCIEAWDADAGEEAALHVTDYAIDSDGANLSAGKKEELQARQQAKVPSGVTVHVADPSRATIKVKTKVAVRSGFDPEATLAAVQARLEELLDPANWATPDFGDALIGGGLLSRLVVRRLELVSEVDRVGGVDYVANLELAKGEAALSTADVELEGQVALTEPGAITVEAV